MIKLKLETKHFDYILSQLSIERKDLSSYIKYYINDGKTIVEIQEELVDEIRDWAGTKLQQVGFDEEYNLTNEGMILEEFADLLYR